MNRFSATVKVIIFLILVGGVIYTVNRLDFFAKQTGALAVQKTVLIEANEYLEKSLDRKTKEDEAKKAKVNLLLAELAGLQDTKRIKEEYRINKEKLRNLSSSYSVVSSENQKLKQSNLSLSHRLTKLTNEFTKTLQEVSDLQIQINEAKTDKFVRKFENQLKKTEAVLARREKEIAALKGKNKNLNSKSSVFTKERKRLENKVSKLEKEKSRLELLVKKIRTGFNERIVELENELLTLQEKSRQVKKIEADRDDLAAKLEQAKEKLAAKERLIAKLETSQGGISVNEVSLATSGSTMEIEGDLSRAYALYDTAKAQVVKFSELLMSKEVELETSKQKIASLEEDLKLLRVQPEVSGDKKYVMMHDRIKMLNEALLAKDDILQKKNEEVSALKQAKTSIEQRLEYQEKEYKNANLLYANLKSQLLQSTELLARRETEVIENNKQVLNLKSELILVQAEYKIKEQELKDLRMQQKKTLDDLSRITNLNINLQNKAQDRSATMGSSQDEKQKADMLKRELEELLGK